MTSENFPMQPLFGDNAIPRAPHNAALDNSADLLDSPNGAVGKRIHQYIAKKKELKRVLQRHHITAVAMSGSIGIGLFINSGEIIGLAGSVGAIFSYLIAGLVVSSVMVCLSEMTSVRPIAGAIFFFPNNFVDPALGFAVGWIYWLQNVTSMVTLVVAGATIFEWQGLSLRLLFPIIGIFIVNFFGDVRLYGFLEWCFKWMKILLVVGFCITMICINLGVGQTCSNPGSEGCTNQKTSGSIGSRYYSSDFAFAPGFSRGLLKNETNATSLEFVTTDILIPGSFGTFMAIWTGTTHAVYAFIGVEMVVITAGEAKFPRQDVPGASRFMYFVTVAFYTVATALVALNVPYNDPDLLRLDDSSILKNSYSPFIIATRNANLGKTLVNLSIAGIVGSAWTAANTNLYIASRTLFALFSRPESEGLLRNTLGKTAENGMPRSAILLSFAPVILAFFAAIPNQGQVTLSTFNTIAVTSALCVYICECVSFVRYKIGYDIDERGEPFRDSEEFKHKYYRAHNQPWIAWFAIISCSLLLFFNGWDSMLAFNHGKIGSGSLVVALVGSYLGPILFLGLFIGYKWLYNTSFTYTKRFQGTAGTELEEMPHSYKNKILERLSWVI